MMSRAPGPHQLCDFTDPTRTMAGGDLGALRRSEVLAVTALTFILGVTAVWWAVALWPAAEGTPAWLQTVRAVCFGAHEDGLPGAGGWILLAGEPLGMTTALYVMWREPLTSGLRSLARRTRGRLLIGGACLVLVVGLGAAGWRVASASRGDGPSALELTTADLSLRRMLGTTPPLRLLDQHGDTLTLERFRGRPVLVTFAYARCETVCPLLVHDALRAQRQLNPTPALVVVTLDPWRDLPSRLPHIANAWRMGSESRVVSGDVAAVQQVLRDWKVEGARDTRTGEVVHAPVTYVLDAGGRIAFATSGRFDELKQAMDRIRLR